MRPNLLLGFVAIIIVVILRDNRYAPAALVLMGFGVAIIFWNGDIRRAFEISFTLPPLTLLRLHDVSYTMLLIGLVQIPLSITNAVIATAALIRDYFPDRAVSERKLMINMGVMNMVSACFGGMPMCHGAGGLAGQYYFGARTGGANILEAVLKVHATGISREVNRSVKALL
ncbi:sulfate permease/MFS superfamily transporter [Candidatus Vecturithrix granuli]|uniref:Sulfate permease/MFS superfamily transporter n=1 Tax=Vecturithrix granuli TaxID=1499967 RepID=A0A081BWK3_VECG1|nr:sulfate permease/MFS superfamily transporter [Candidatus Vecturithrix granuli]